MKPLPVCHAFALDHNYFTLYTSLEQYSNLRKFSAYSAIYIFSQWIDKDHSAQWKIPNLKNSQQLTKLRSRKLPKINQVSWCRSGDTKVMAHHEKYEKTKRRGMLNSLGMLKRRVTMSAPTKPGVKEDILLATSSTFKSACSVMGFKWTRKIFSLSLKPIKMQWAFWDHLKHLTLI